MSFSRRKDDDVLGYLIYYVLFQHFCRALAHNPDTLCPRGSSCLFQKFIYYRIIKAGPVYFAVIQNQVEDLAMNSRALSPVMELPATAKTQRRKREAQKCYFRGCQTVLPNSKCNTLSAKTGDTQVGRTKSSRRVYFKVAVRCLADSLIELEEVK
jgi:hypothetical protein